MPTTSELLSFLSAHAHKLELRWFDHEGRAWVNLAFRWENGLGPIVATLCWTYVREQLAG